MYVSVWKRFWAFIIDVCVFALLFIVLAQLMDDFTVSLVLLVLIWLYYALLESSPWQASLGKRMMGLKVVDKRGRRLTFVKATKRLLSRLVTNLTFYFGFFTAAFDSHKETLHDKMSKSVVISKNCEFNPDDYQEPDNHDITLPVVGGAAPIPKNRRPFKCRHHYRQLKPGRPKPPSPHTGRPGRRRNLAQKLYGLRQ